jgi:2-dehydropantoate 2-reductase
MIDNLLVIGAGAVGGWIGSGLQSAGRDVTFLVREKRAADLARDGLRLTTDEGVSTITPKTVIADRLGFHPDVILLSVKAYALEQAMEDFAPAVGPETMILPVLNGMRHMKLLEEKFGYERIIGGVCRVNASLDSDGGVVQQGAVRQLLFGERGRAGAGRMQDFLAFFDIPGIDAAISPDIEQEMWEKWVQLASIGAITTLFDGTLGAVASVPGGADLARAVVDECGKAVVAAGHPAREAALASCKKLVSDPTSPMTTSMYRDMRSGLHVEAEAIVGDLVKDSTEAGIEAPLLTAALTRLRVYEDNLSKAG